MAILGSPYDRAGSWTPTLTFATPGDLAVTYANRLGVYTKVGRLLVAQFVVSTSAFTHTTASGSCQVTGLPFSNGSPSSTFGSLSWQGITKANYTNIVTRVANATQIVTLRAMGSGQTVADIAAADMPTGGSVSLQGQTIYIVTNT